MKIWVMGLSGFLVLNGLVSVIGLSFQYDHMVIGGLSLATGVLVFLQK